MIDGRRIAITEIMTEITPFFWCFIIATIPKIIPNKLQGYVNGANINNQGLNRGSTAKIIAMMVKTKAAVPHPPFCVFIYDN